MSYSPYGFSKVKYHLQYAPKIAQQYFKLFKWKKNLKIIDIGTGPGHLLFEVEPLFPKDYAEILCTDKQEHMVKHFDSIKKDHRMTSLQMDIETTNLPDKLKNRFDFVFSCNCLMYLSNIRQTFLKVSQLLTRNGELFFIWPKRCDVHDLYKAMSNIQKWAPYMSEFKNWNNYFDTESPTDTLKTELQRVNIEVIKTELIDVALEDADEKNLVDMFHSLDYISARIPKCDLHQYKDDFLNTVRSKIISEPEAGNGIKSLVPFSSLVVAARKTEF